MENTQKTWVQVWTENYLGQSDLARGITVKNNYKGNSYIGWAVMERCLSMLDPESEIILEQTENGNYVHTTRDVLRNKKPDGSISEVEIIAHFVKVSVVFMSKKFMELFPIQDNSYAAVRSYDQNDINKAIQRAKAKVISRATGIGWALYESGDLQYELDEKKTPTPTPSAATATVETKAATTTVKAVEQTVSVNGQEMDAPQVADTTATVIPEASEDVAEMQEVFDLIHAADAAKAQSVLDFINKQLQKQYNKVITLEGGFDEFEAIINVTAKPKLVLNALRTQLAK